MLSLIFSTFLEYQAIPVSGQPPELEIDTAQKLSFTLL